MKTVTIPMYRIVPSNAGIGWVCVEKWNGNMYAHVATLRTRSQAETFIENK